MNRKAHVPYCFRCEKWFLNHHNEQLCTNCGNTLQYSWTAVEFVNGLPMRVIKGGDSLICCGEGMEPVGLGDCNGWRCKKCGKETIDIASYKMSNKDG